MAAFETLAFPLRLLVPAMPCIGRGLKQRKDHPMTNKPSFIAFTVRQRNEGEKATWTAIGVTWAHKKGTGFNIELEALPIDGRIVLMPPSDGDHKD